MGEIGNFGDIVFEVSDLKKMSFKDFTRDTASKYQNHELIGQKPRTEFVAPGLDTVSFTVLLNAQFGVKPQDEMNKWLEYCRGGDAFPLIIGNRPLGVDMWVVTSISQHWDRIYSNGELVAGTVDVSMQEYLSAPWTVKGYREGWLAKQKAKEKELAEAKAAGYNKTNTGSTNGINLDVDLDNWEPPAIDGAYMFLDPVSAVQSLQNTIRSIDWLAPNEEKIKLQKEIQLHLEEIRQDKAQKRNEFYSILYGSPQMIGASDIWKRPVSGIDIVKYVQKKGIELKSIRNYSEDASFKRGDRIFNLYPKKEYDFYQISVENPVSYSVFSNICGPFWELDCSLRAFETIKNVFSIAISLVSVGMTTCFALKNIDLAKIDVNLLRINWDGMASVGKADIYVWPSIEVVSESYWVATDITALSAFQLAVLAESLQKNGVSGSSSGSDNWAKDLIGAKTSNGTEITGVSDHAAERMAERNITPDIVKDTITNPNSTYPGNSPNVTCYQKGNIRVVVGDDGTIITVIKLGGGI